MRFGEKLWWTLAVVVALSWTFMGAAGIGVALMSLPLVALAMRARRRRQKLEPDKAGEEDELSLSRVWHARTQTRASFAYARDISGYKILEPSSYRWPSGIPTDLPPDIHPLPPADAERATHDRDWHELSDDEFARIKRAQIADAEARQQSAERRDEADDLLGPRGSSPGCGQVPRRCS